MAASALYPGSFDPITRGHLDILERFQKVFDKIYVAVGNSTKKTYLFDFHERAELVRQVTRNLANIEVIAFDGLTVDCARQVNAEFILRGVRTAGDFEYEQRMANMNYRLDSSIDTILVYSKPELNIISSSLIKEVAILGGDINPFVPEEVAQRLYQKLQEKKETSRE